MGSRNPKSTFVDIGAGDFHTCGLREDGSVVCRGQDFFGEASPHEDETFVNVTAGRGNFTCGVQQDGGILCWNGWALVIHP